MMPPLSSSSFTSAAQPPPPHGTKRKPDDTLDNEQRLTKRFDLLNLDQRNGVKNHKLYIPVSAEPLFPTSAPAPSDSNAAIAPSPPQFSRLRKPIDEWMEIEDSPHRVYIHDLDAELDEVASQASNEDAPIFLPDIDKHLSKLPKYTLFDQATRNEALNQQLILYSVPQSLSIPEEKDSVRKAIIEARQRARERQERGDVDVMQILNKDDMSPAPPAYVAQSSYSGSGMGEHDPDMMPVAEDLDAMDIG